MTGVTLTSLLQPIIGLCGLKATPVQAPDRLLVELTTSEMALVEQVWARFVPVLCDQQLVRGVSRVPLVNFEGLKVIWAEETPIVFYTPQTNPHLFLPEIKGVPEPVTLSLGGKSCSGKTTLARLLKQLMPGEVLTYPAFTNRPKRDGEMDGVDYHFRSDQDLETARQDVRFSGFVEARGYWYWVDPSILLRSIWANPEAIHLFFISQRHDFEQRRRLFPGMKWVWLEVSEEEILRRLTVSLDRDLASSLEYNQKLSWEKMIDLLDMVMRNEKPDLERNTEILRLLCQFMQKKRRGQM